MKICMISFIAGGCSGMFIGHFTEWHECTKWPLESVSWLWRTLCVTSGSMVAASIGLYVCHRLRIRWEV